jgi:hypothetical protein
LIVLGRTTALSPTQAAHLGACSNHPTSRTLAHVVMGTGHFGGDPRDNHAKPEVVVEVSAGPALHLVAADTRCATCEPGHD